MKLLLTSFGHDSIGDFVQGTVAYVPDAARLFAGDPTHAPWVNTERDLLRGHGLEITELPLLSTPPADIDRILSESDAIYVAGGETFDLLHILRSTGADEIITRHVRAGLPYIGTSAGSVVAGPSIEAVALLDDPGTAPDLHDYTGLGFTEHVIIPHASGSAPQFPISVFAETVRRFGEHHQLLLLRDGQALLVDDTGAHLI